MKQKGINKIKLILISLLLIATSCLNNQVMATPDIVLELELTINSNPTREEYAFQIQQTLREIGINLTIRVKEENVYPMEQEIDHQMMLVGFSLGTDPDLSTFFHSEGGLSRFLFGQWNDSYNDALLEVGLLTADPFERKIIYDEWQDYVMDELPCLPLASPTTYSARKAIIQNYDPQYGSFYPTITRADGGITLVYASTADPINLNPVQYTDISSSEAFSACLDGLYSYDYNFNVVPQLASGHPIISEDHLSWTIPLREDVYWHDGEQFTAEDIYFSVMAYCNPSNSTDYGLAGDTGSIHTDQWEAIYDVGDGIFTGNVTVLDPFTVQFKMPKVYAPFATTHLITSIIPEHILNVTDSDLDGFISDEAPWLSYSNGTHHIGTGSYYFNSDDWVGEIEYMNRLRTDSTNPYWAGALSPDIDPLNVPLNYTWTDEDVYQIEQLITRIIPQMATQIIEFDAGNLDFIDLFANPELIPVYEADPRFNVTFAYSYSYEVLAFNMEDPIFKAEPIKGRALRKAIAFAIDRQTMVETIKDGYAVVCDNPLPPANTYYYNWNNPIIYRYNIDKALDYMSDAGYSIYTSEYTGPGADFGQFDGPTSNPRNPIILYGVILGLSLMVLSYILTNSRKTKKVKF